MLMGLNKWTNSGYNTILGYCAAPLYQQVINWLIEKHNLLVKVSVGGNNDIYPKWIIDGILDISNPNCAIEWELEDLKKNYEDMVF
jgi:hypothetical protein